MIKRLLPVNLAVFLLLAVAQADAAVVVNENTLISGTYTVPTNGQVTITITGADGGDGSNTNGGSGATVTGVFDVTAGQVIRYVVGEAGITTAGSSAGGGGSTGVYIDTTLVMVAGAGGGGDNSNGAVGLGGNTGTAGDSGTGSGAGAGGTGGNGGGANTSDSAGGGGINSAGGSAAADGGGQAVAAPALPGLLVIAPGGSGNSSGTAGGQGFSGGGGADFQYSGGAGGYSGGGAAGANGSAGGGGSYINTGMTGYVSSTLVTGVDGGGGNSGAESDGSIVVDITAPGVNPLPASDTNAAPKVCSASGADGSSPTSGVVNTYYPAAASVTSGATAITLGASIGNTTGIAVGDLVMVIQMQDADINSTDTANYGDNLGAGAGSGSLTINQTGLYEFAIAASAVGTGGGALSLSTGLTHAYNQGTNKTFQVIRVPRYGDLTLSADITAAAWNGSAGGVVSIDVLGTLDFNNFNIDMAGSDVSGDPVGPGFRPGVYVGGTSGAESNADPAFVQVGAGLDADLWAEKAEGIAGTPGVTYFGDVNLGYLNGSLARGAPGNAGGGGNDHNGGGGGGSNIGYGGQGGDGWSAGTDAGGRGGGTFAGYVGRLLLGGGGGAANANNNVVAGAGGSGGGLIFINATTITGAGTIDASGGRAVDSNVGYPQGNDGAGGGGGGGTIVIRTASATVSGLTLDVSGGDGGDVITGSPHGPGGGGGGGAVYIDATGASIDVTGGTAGIFYDSDFNPAQDSGNHGALPGGDGQALPLDPANMPVPVACDYPDENGYSSTATVHQVDPASGTGIADLSIGSVVDYEPAATPSAAADSDDASDTSGTAAGNDESGVAFSSPAGTGQSIIADVTVNNPTGATVTVCGWLDVPSAGGVVDGVYDATPDGFCQTTTQTSGTVTFTWPGMPTDQVYTTYARFRITSGSMTTADAISTAPDGEVESYQVKFDFTPTAVTIGKVELTATRVNDFLAGLNVEQMDTIALLALLEAWDAEAAASTGSDRADLLQALSQYLDPDLDGQVAVLFWDTLEERGTIGFYVERKQGDADWLQINNDMLPGLITAPMGGEYQLADPSAGAGKQYQYRLIEQEARGTKRTYGPYTLEIQ